MKIREGYVHITMSKVKDAATRQYARIINEASAQITPVSRPPEGWIATLRKALGMSAPVLARRLGVTKPAIYQVERKELEGGVTLQHMERLAGAMGGTFVYAILPKGSVNDVLAEQAERKALSLVGRVSAHMALEDQSLAPSEVSDEIKRLAQELLSNRPPDFWDDE